MYLLPCATPSTIRSLQAQYRLSGASSQRQCASSAQAMALCSPIPRTHSAANWERKALLKKMNEAVTITEVGNRKLKIERDGGEIGYVDPEKIVGFDVCEKCRIKIAPGEKLLLQGNSRSDCSGTGGALVNGQIVEAKEILTGCIHLKDGRILPREYRRFCHGYAVTSHASQGKTVEVLVVASNDSFLAVNREQFMFPFRAAGREALSPRTTRRNFGHGSAFHRNGSRRLN